MVDEWDDARRIGTRPHTVGEHFAAEQPQPAPLPDEAFETGTWLTPRVDQFSQITGVAAVIDHEVGGVKLTRTCRPTRRTGTE